LWVANETTQGENFAEKWNRDLELSEAFADWHKNAVRDFRTLAETGDAETTFSVLKSVAGSRIAASVRNRATQTVTDARVHGALRSGSTGALGLTIGLPIAANTFFGS